MASKEYHLVVFGLSEHEQRVMKTISIVSRLRSRSYVLEKTATSNADFAVVGGDDPQALAEWHAFQASHPMVPAIMVGRMPATKSTELWIGRPIMATKLLAVLDKMQVSKERPAFAQEKAHDTKSARFATHTSARQQPQANSDVTVRKALVVDDSLPIRRQMKIKLQSFVGRVDLAENGEQAVELLATNSYDIVFLDVVLPGMDGYQICRKIKHSKETKKMPVIMLTGKSSPFDRVRGKLAGCNTYLTKPVDQAKFDKAVGTFLGQVERRHHMGSYMHGRIVPEQTLSAPALS